MAFGVVTYFLRKQGNGKKNRPVALDPQKKIPFKLVDRKVSAYKLPEGASELTFFFIISWGFFVRERYLPRQEEACHLLGLKYMNVVMNHYMLSVSVSIYVVFALC